MLFELASRTDSAPDSPVLMILSILYPCVLFGLVAFIWMRRRKKYGGPPNSRAHHWRALRRLPMCEAGRPRVIVLGIVTIRRFVAFTCS